MPGKQIKNTCIGVSFHSSRTSTRMHWNSITVITFYSRTPKQRHVWRSPKSHGIIMVCLKSSVINHVVCCLKTIHCIQLNQYETVSYFIQLSQNLTSDCLLISVFYLFLPVFAWCDHRIVLQIKTEQFCDHIIQKLVKTQKLTNNSMSRFA